MPPHPFSCAKPALLLSLAALAIAAPAYARPGDYGPSWGNTASDRHDMRQDRLNPRSDKPEGQIKVSRFVADGLAPGTLAHGAIAVAAAPAADWDPRELATYEAAVIDELVHAGYDTATPGSEGGQIVELRIARQQVEPQEAPHKPVSGEMTVGASNRGTMTGMAINIDLSKPRPALLSTRLEARIRDVASNKVLWEGRAEMPTREGDSRSTDQAIATKLAQALFDGFPNRSGGT